MRLVGDGKGGCVLDRTAPGRGAWLCPGSPACAAEARRRGAVARALRTAVRDDALAAALARAVAAPAQNLADLHVAGRSSGTPCSTTKG